MDWDIFESSSEGVGGMLTLLGLAKASSVQVFVDRTRKRIFGNHILRQLGHDSSSQPFYCFMFQKRTAFYLTSFPRLVREMPSQWSQTFPHLRRKGRVADQTLHKEKRQSDAATHPILTPIFGLLQCYPRTFSRGCQCVCSMPSSNRRIFLYHLRQIL